MLEQLNGYKSYILGSLMVIITVLYALGIVDRETFEAIVGLLGGGSILTLRSAINNK